MTELLTDDAILDAISSIVGEGLYPTHALLRERLSGRGDPRRYQRLLRTWYRLHGPQLVNTARPSEGTADGEVPEVLRKLWKDLEEAVRRDLKAQYEEERQRLAEQLQASAATIAKLEAQLAEQQQREQAHQRAIAEHEQALAAVVAERDQAHAQIAELKNAAIMAERERSALSERLDALAEERRSMETMLVNERARHELLRRQYDEQAAQIEGFRQALDGKAAEIARLERALEDAHRQVHGLQDQLRALTSALEAERQHARAREQAFHERLAQLAEHHAQERAAWLSALYVRMRDRPDGEERDERREG